MGSCVSVPKQPALKLRRPSLGPNNNEVLLFPAATSPVKRNSDTVNAGDPTVPGFPNKSQPSPLRFRGTAGDGDCGGAPQFVTGSSKDEAFFDSQPWLDSDCDDDFLSVNGDGSGSPNGGSTPLSLHQGIRTGTTLGSVPHQLSSHLPDRRKRLSQLFRADDSDTSVDIRKLQDNGLKANRVEGAAISLLPQRVQPNSPDRRRPSSSLFRSDERTAHGESLHLPPQENNKPVVKSAHCCLPSWGASKPSKL